MKYLVMACHDSYCVLLDEEGNFVYAANLRYQVGDSIENPVLMEMMQEEPKKQKHFFSLKWASLAAVLTCFVLFFFQVFHNQSLQPYTTILLTINPAVKIELNRNQQVVGIVGVNEDGIVLIEGYQAKGKSYTTVTDELIHRAIEMGFLYEGGKITINIDSPDEASFEALGVELRTNLEQGVNSEMKITVEIHRSSDELTNQKTPTPQANQPTFAPNKDIDDDWMDDQDDEDDKDDDDFDDDEDDFDDDDRDSDE